MSIVTKLANFKLQSYEKIIILINIINQVLGTQQIFVIPKHKIIHYFLKKKDALQISFWPLVNELLMHHSIFNCRWRFFVHGCVDSYSRKIMYLSCSGNNKAETVLAHFFTSGCCSWASLKDERWPWCWECGSCLVYVQSPIQRTR